MFHCYECGAQIDRSVWKSRCVSCVVKKLKENLRENEELRKRLAEAEAKNTELEKELFILASDVIYFENQTLPYEIVRKAKRVYDELCGSGGWEG